MKSKLIMNIKKLISILLTTALISSIFPSNLLNSAAFALDKSVSSFKELQTTISNANNGDTILLDKDITIPNSAQFNITKGITITSHGDTKTITLDESNGQSQKTAVFNIFNGCTVNFENITVDLSTKKELKFPLIKLNSNSTLNINLGTNIKTSIHPIH